MCDDEITHQEARSYRWYRLSPALSIPMLLDRALRVTGLSRAAPKQISLCATKPTSCGKLRTPYGVILVEKLLQASSNSLIIPGRNGLIDEELLGPESFSSDALVVLCCGKLPDPTADCRCTVICDGPANDLLDSIYFCIHGVLAQNS